MGDFGPELPTFLFRRQAAWPVHLRLLLRRLIFQACFFNAVNIKHEQY